MIRVSGLGKKGAVTDGLTDGAGCRDAWPLIFHRHLDEVSEMLKTRIGMAGFWGIFLVGAISPHANNMFLVFILVPVQCISMHVYQDPTSGADYMIVP